MAYALVLIPLKSCGTSKQDNKVRFEKLLDESLARNVPVDVLTKP